MAVRQLVFAWRALYGVCPLVILSLIALPTWAEEGREDPLTVDAAMLAWAERIAPSELPTEVRLRRLLAGLLSEDELALTEVVRPTLTARQAFRERRANCVSFAALFVALARAGGAPVVFVRVGEPRMGTPGGDLRVAEGHLAAAWRVDERVRVYDFGGVSEPAAEEVEPVTDLTALAVFASNRGAESLLADDTAAALAHLRRAVELDPWLTDAWINLGVTRRRAGDSAGATAAYREALRLDPTAAVAAQNLAFLLQLEGQASEAARALEITAQLASEDAFGFLQRGRLSLELGDLTAARSFYRKALELSLRRADGGS